MLERLTIYILELMIIGMVCGMGYIIVLMWRFLIRAEEAIHLYEMSKETIAKNVFYEEPVEFVYRERFYNAKLEISSPIFACVQLEELIKEALFYYNKLGYIARSVKDMGEYEKKLQEIYKEIRQMRESFQKERS